MTRKNKKTKQAKLKKFQQLKKQLEDLTASPLYKVRKENNYLPVIGEGNLNAKVMFIGEAPGKNEAEKGRPFIGAAGKMLDNYLKLADLNRKNVFITSVLHDRPPKNRDPHKKELEIYKPIWTGLVDIIRPNLIVTLGRISMAEVMKYYGLKGKIKLITKIHGKQFIYHGLIIYPVHHPAAVLYNRKLEETVKRDFKRIGELI